jgi:hypothetical protein
VCDITHGRCAINIAYSINAVQKPGSVTVRTQGSKTLQAVRKAVPAVRRMVQQCLKNTASPWERSEGPQTASKWVEDFRIPDDDVREALRGELGLRAKEAIPLSTPICVYRYSLQSIWLLFAQVVLYFSCILVSSFLPPASVLSATWILVISLLSSSTCRKGADQMYVLVIDDGQEAF